MALMGIITADRVAIALTVIMAVVPVQILHVLIYSRTLTGGMSAWRAHWSKVSLIGDVTVAIILRHIMSEYRGRLSDPMDAIRVGLFVTLLYIALEASHVYWHTKSLAQHMPIHVGGRTFNFLLHSSHKLVLLFIMVVMIMLLNKLGILPKSAAGKA